MSVIYRSTRKYPIRNDWKRNMQIFGKLRIIKTPAIVPYSSVSYCPVNKQVTQKLCTTFYNISIEISTLSNRNTPWGKHQTNLTWKIRRNHRMICLKQTTLVSKDQQVVPSFLFQLQLIRSLRTHPLTHLYCKKSFFFYHL